MSPWRSKGGGQVGWGWVAAVFSPGAGDDFELFPVVHHHGVAAADDLVAVVTVLLGRLFERQGKQADGVAVPFRIEIDDPGVFITKEETGIAGVPASRQLMPYQNQ